MGGLGSVLAVILAVRLSAGTGQSLKVCVAMLLCKTDTHSGTPGPSPVLCNRGTQIAGGLVCLCEQQHLVRTSYSTSDVPRKSTSPNTSQTNMTRNADSYGLAGDRYED